MPASSTDRTGGIAGPAPVAQALPEYVTRVASAVTQASQPTSGVMNCQAPSSQSAIFPDCPAQTAAILFQTNFSGRAELGTLGNNNFALKVSGNGTSYTTALEVNATSAGVELFRPVLLTGQSSPPASPANGHLWHDSTRGQLMARIAGQSRMIDQQADIPCLVPPSGEYVSTTMGSGGATTVLSGAANRIDIFPYIPGADLEANALGVNCSTAVAGALCKLVVYDALADGTPGSLLLETGTADLSTTGNKVLTASLTLYRGRTYWLGVRHSAVSYTHLTLPTILRV